MAPKKKKGSKGGAGSEHSRAAGGGGGVKRVVQLACYVTACTGILFVVMLSPGRYRAAVDMLFLRGSTSSTQIVNQQVGHHEIESLENILSEKPARQTSKEIVSLESVLFSESPPIKPSVKKISPTAAKSGAGTLRTGNHIAVPQQIPTVTTTRAKVTHESMSWKDFAKIPYIPEPKRFGNLTALGLNRCPQSIVEALKKPGLSNEDYKWCQWALSSEGGNVQVRSGNIFCKCLINCFGGGNRLANLTVDWRDLIGPNMII
jgi:hypothetical protein